MEMIYFNSLKNIKMNDTGKIHDFAEILSECVILRSLVETKDCNTLVLVHNLNHELIYHSNSLNLLINDKSSDALVVDKLVQLQNESFINKDVKEFWAIFNVVEFTHLAYLQMLGNVFSLNNSLDSIVGWITVLTPLVNKNFNILLNMIDRKYQINIMKQLTELEYKIVYLISNGYSQSIISDKLSITKGYISKIISTSIFKKLQCKSSKEISELVENYALKNLIPKEYLTTKLKNKNLVH